MSPGSDTLLVPSPIKAEQRQNERATNVHIAVRKLESGEYELHVYPMRSGDTMIFHALKLEDEAPEKPRQVRWVVSGLVGGQKIRIEPKQKNTGYLPLERYEIEYPNNSVRSGEAQRHPENHVELTWAYNVILLEQVLAPASAPQADVVEKELARVDPRVIIKDEP